jgi:hypothetical protein
MHIQSNNMKPIIKPKVHYHVHKTHNGYLSRVSWIQSTSIYDALSLTNFSPLTANMVHLYMQVSGPKWLLIFPFYDNSKGIKNILPQKTPFHGPRMDETKTIVKSFLLYKSPEKCITHLEGQRSVTGLPITDTHIVPRLSKTNILGCNKHIIECFKYNCFIYFTKH